MVSITILIPTYNRANVLQQTFDKLRHIEMDGIDCNIIVIDNNSDDNTYDVIVEYKKYLPIIYLKEIRQGKNCALNKALKECKMKDIIVFTDDDITPDKDWLKEIVSSTI